MKMKKSGIIIALVALLASAMHLTSCAQPKEKGNNEMKEKKVLVAFFSRTGENYGVGHITKGNTHIIADMIVAATGADKFEIVPEKAYPDSYQECVDQAQEEQKAGARPAVKGDINIEDYDVIFVGYPNWWGDMPMPVYTFLEKHDWNGKTIVPFCTHEGSGLGSTPVRLQKACSGATMLDGLDVQGTVAQNSQPKAKQLVEKWLKKMGF